MSSSTPWFTDKSSSATSVGYGGGICTYASDSTDCNLRAPLDADVIEMMSTGGGRGDALPGRYDATYGLSGGASDSSYRSDRSRIS
jgi:hypothetical protein